MRTNFEPLRTARAWGVNPWVLATYVSTTSFSVPGNAGLEVGTSVQVLNNNVLRTGYVTSSNFAANITTVVVEGATALTNSTNTMVRFGGEVGNAHLSKQFGYVDVQGSFVSRGVGDFTSASSTNVNGAWQFNSVPVFAGGVSTGDGGKLRIQVSSVTPLSGTTVSIDVAGAYLRIYESGSPNKGVRIDLTNASALSSSDVWHSGNFDPASKLNVSGGTMSGMLNHYVGAIASQTTLQRYGWANNVLRWAWVLDSDGSLVLASYDSAGATSTSSLTIKTVVAGGVDQLQFRGNTVWHGGNFDPASKLTRTGDIASGQIIFDGSPLTTMATATSGLSQVMVRSTGSNLPAISFHRAGTFALYLGLHTDNNLHVGGWSYGANSWKVWHGGAGALSTNSALTAGSLTANSSLIVGTTLTVTGAAAFASTLSVAGTATVQDLAVVNILSGLSALFMGAVGTGNLTVTGNIAASAHVVSSTYMQATRWLHVGNANGFGGQSTQGTYITWNHNSGLGESGFFNNRGSGAGGFDFYHGTGGTYTRIARILGTGDFASLSDASLKKNFSAMDTPHALNFVRNVNSGFYAWIRDGKEDVGFLADDVEKWTMRLIHKDGIGIRSLAYQKISAYHHTALKYVLSETEALRQEVNVLKEQVRLLGGE